MSLPSFSSFPSRPISTASSHPNDPQPSTSALSTQLPLQAVPSFSSFPARPSATSNGAGPSGPSFSSFPERNGGKVGQSIGGENDEMRKRKDREREREDEGERRKRKHRDRDRERDVERDRSRHRHEDRSRSTSRSRAADKDKGHRSKKHRSDRDQEREGETEAERRWRKEKERERGKDRDRDRDRERNRRSDYHHDDKDESRGKKAYRSRSPSNPSTHPPPPPHQSTPHPNPSTSTSNTHPAETTTFGTVPHSDIFFIDRTGDEGNLRYGGMEVGKVARYIAHGYGRVVGLDDGHRIDRKQAGSGRGVTITRRGDATDESAKGTLLKPLTGPSLRLRHHPTEEDPLISSQTEFISLPTPRRKPDSTPAGSSSAVNNHSVIPDREHLLRSEAFWEEEEILQRKKRLEEEGYVEEGDEDDLLGDDVEREETVDERRKREVLEFERRVRGDPGDVEGWIGYANLYLHGGGGHHQSSKSGSSSNTAKSKRESAKAELKRADCEIASEIILKAFKSSSSNRSSPRLQRAYFEAVKNVWPVEKVTAAWKDVLKDLTDAKGVDQGELMELWLEFIAWREGRGLGTQKNVGGAEGGGVEDVVGVYVECMDAMRVAWRRGGPGTQALEENLVYLLLRCCLLLKHAGYVERGTAAVQAMLELTFFKPVHLRRTLFNDVAVWEARLVEELEAFWDAEALRTGEEGAKGWTHWKPQEEMEVDGLTDSNRPDIYDNSVADPYLRWYHDEVRAEKQDYRPARALDLEADDEDPFRTVLFSDISPFLFIIESPDVKLQLAYAALNFFGLRMIPPGSGSEAPFFRDTHLSWDLDTDPGRLWPTPPAQHEVAGLLGNGEAAGTEAKQMLPRCPFQACAVDGSTVCPDIAPWFALLSGEAGSGGLTTIAKNILQQLQVVVYDPAFKTVYLALESFENKKGARDAAKALVAEDRTNIQLYANYARLLRQQGKTKEARSVYSTCLFSLKETDKDSAEGELYMHLAAEWAEMEWLVGEMGHCMSISVAATALAAVNNIDQRPLGPALLRAKQIYARNNGWHPDQSRLRYLFIHCQAGFQTAWNEVIPDLQMMSTGSAIEEEAYQFAARLIWTHSHANHIKPDIVRKFLEQAIPSFPNNTLFLSLYLATESHSQIYGRLHRLIEEEVLEKRDAAITTLLWGAWAEAQMNGQGVWANGSASAERVRHVFDRALETCGSSAAVWKAYIEFEALQQRPIAAKRLCYRAVTEVGTAKYIYMLPFSPLLRPHFTDRELQDWAEVMIEKGIRTRRPFEQYWQPHIPVDDMAVDKFDDEEGAREEDKVFDFLRERKTLMPY